MIISHERRFIFVKTRKTAGTSIEIALSQYCGPRDVIARITPSDEAFRKELGYRGAQNFELPYRKYRLADWSALLGSRRRLWYYNHMPATDIRRLVGAEVWDGYRKVSIERNPWDKALSLYFWRTHGMDDPPPLLDYLRSVEPGSLSNFDVYGIDGVVAVDYVARYEDFGTEMQRMAEMLGLPAALSPPRAKGGVRKDRRHYKDYMGKPEADIVARVCAREIEHFGFSF